MTAPNENHDPTTLDDLHDRLVDRGLAELVGRETVPNLSARILAATVPAAAATIEAPRTRSSRAFWASLVVAAMLLVGVTIAMLPWGLSPAVVRNLAKIDPASNNMRQAGRAQATVIDRSIVESAEPAASGRLMVGDGVNSDAGAVPLPNFTTDLDVPFRQGSFDQNQTGQRFRIEAAPGTEAQRYQVQFDQPHDNIGLQGLISDSHELPADAPATSAAPYSHSLPAQTSAPVGSYAGVEEPELRFSANAIGREDVLRQMHSSIVASDGDGSRPLSMLVTPRIIIQLNEEERLRIGDGPDKTAALGTGPGLSGDQYTRIVENPFVKAEGGAAVSTFSIDVDTASYANVRQFLLQMNALPPPDAVRIEELVNYFDYNYAGPPTDANDANESAPFAAHVEVAGCPWATDHRLARIGIKGRELDRNKRPKSNLVFLVDVSGSMDEPAKLPLVVYGLQQLTRELGENDRVAIVVYASSEGLVLPSTPGTKQDEIQAALGRLQAGGSTAGGAGIQLAYQLAEDNFIQGGTNRVILCTDGDFNVGVTSTAELERMVEKKAKDTRVFLSVLGFGRGNLNDAMMEAISDHGNGNYHYVDNRTEARRVLVEEMTGTLVTIAKDVKIQVEFNPRQVAGYRLIGYENRMLRTEDFNDDKKDAGEIGAGHTVTALYEIVPAGTPVAVGPVDGLKYQQPDKGAWGRGPAEPPGASPSGGSPEARPQPPNEQSDIAGELLTLKMRYKEPEGDTSRKLEWPVSDDGKAFSAATGDFQFAAAVAGFGLLLRESQHKGNLTYAADLELAQGGVGRDEHGYRAEFLEMIRRAKTLRGE